MEPEIYDRENEFKKLSSFLTDQRVNSIFLQGESGVGKSALLSKTLQSINLTAETVSFSFKDAESDTNAPFAEFLEELNRETRQSFISKHTFLKLKDMRISIPFLSISYEFSTQKIDKNYLIYLMEKLKAAGKSVLRIENVELCKNSDDLRIIKLLSKFQTSDLKLIFEIGSLSNFYSEITDIFPKNDHSHQHFEIEPFNKHHTDRLHKFIHSEEAPPDLFRKSRGLALAVEFKADASDLGNRLKWVDAKLRELSEEQRYLAYAVALIGEPAPLFLLEKAYGQSNVASIVTNSLIDIGILVDTIDGITFRHPSFSHALLKERKPSLEKKIKHSLLNYLLKKKILSQTEKLLALEYASYLGKGEIVSDLAKTLLIENYEQQDARKNVFFIENILHWSTLDQHKTGILKLIQIQSYCQLSNIDKAKSVLMDLGELALKDERVSLFNAMIESLSNNQTKSNKILLKVLPKLSPRNSVFALCVQIANDIPLQEKESALTAMQEALAISRNNDFKELEEELVRLSAKLSTSQALAIEEMKDFLASRNRWHSGLAYARFIHNLGVQELLTSRGERGDEYLKEARSYFEKTGLHFASYSATAQSVLAVGQNNLDDAEEILLDGISLCNEAYDTVSIFNNLGCIQLLNGEIDNARDALNNAMNGFQYEGRDLDDPILKSAVTQNLALVELKCGNFSLANDFIEQLPNLEFARELGHRENRRKRIEEAIILNNQSFELKNIDFDQKSWMYSEYNVSFLTLSFYDYPFILVDQAELELKLSEDFTQ